MKKIIRYIFVSMAFSLALVAIDVIGGRILFGPQSNVVYDNADGDVSTFDKYAESVGVCSGNKPLLLTNGECAPCDYNAESDVYVLLGCEKCSNMAASDCAFHMGIDDDVPNDMKKIVTGNNHKGSENHKYTLIKIIGDGDRVRITLRENATGQKSIVSVGDVLDGWVIKLISFDGIIVEKDGKIETLDIGG